MEVDETFALLLTSVSFF